MFLIQLKIVEALSFRVYDRSSTLPLSSSHIAVVRSIVAVQIEFVTFTSTLFLA